MESSDKGDVLRKEERFGYLSVHYLVPLLRQRTDLPEYRRFDGLVAEIQVRTILQHAWAEIEHDIQYKSLTTIPSGVRRRFMSLAGLLEIADRELQAVQDEDERIRNEAKISIQMDQLENVEITADALRKYLDKEIDRIRELHTGHMTGARDFFADSALLTLSRSTSAYQSTRTMI
jgi:putative GTP pyrophosphokinase